MKSILDHHIPCEEVVRAVWEYLDDELSEERAWLIREHLEICKGCRDFFTFEGAFLRAVSGLIAADADVTNLRARVVDALRQQGYTDFDIASGGNPSFG